VKTINWDKGSYYLNGGNGSYLLDCKNNAIFHNWIQSTPRTGIVAVGVDNGVTAARTGKVVRTVINARVSPNIRRVHMVRVTRQRTIRSSQKPLTKPTVERLSIGPCTVRCLFAETSTYNSSWLLMSRRSSPGRSSPCCWTLSPFINDRTAVSHEIGDSSPSIRRFLDCLMLETCRTDAIRQ
jgi:hypothetical protein